MPTLEERLAKAQKGTLEQRLANAQSSDTAVGAGADKAARTFLNNLLGAIPAAGKVAVSALEAPTRLLLDKEPAKTGVTKALGNIPRPTIEGTAAGIRSLPALFPGGEKFSERKERELLDINTESERLATKFPKATGIGDVAGDVATIFTGRMPLVGKIQKLEKGLEGAARKLITQPKVPGLKAAAVEALNSNKVRTLAKGLGRSLEAGLEAASLDLIKGGDGLEVGTYVAAGQAAGSLSLQAVTKPTGRKLAASAIAFGAMIQLLKNTVPGEQSGVISSIEFGFEKVQLALVLGTLSGLAGAGRVRGKNFPILTDAMTTIPRASLISFLQDYVSGTPEAQATVDQVLEKLSTDPEFFGEELTQRLQKAINDGTLMQELQKVIPNGK